MQTEMITINKTRNVTLTAYTQPVGAKFDYVAKRPAILILPGGAYRYCSDREADPVAFAYLKAGYQAFILRYSVAEHSTWPNPLEDVEAALEMIRSREDWNVYPDKVAVIGFSAGGHLAAAAATMAKDRPNAAILGYAVVSNDAKGCCLTAPDTIAAVDKNTCPCFIFSSRTDETVPIRNSIDFMGALADAGIAFESHIYAYGPHGFSTCYSSVHFNGKPVCVRTPNWVADSIGWLKDVLGDFGQGEMTQPVCPGHVNDDHLDYLTVDSTVRKVMANEEARRLVEPGMAAMHARFNEHGVDGMSLVHNMKLRMLLAVAGVKPEQVREIDEKLRKIKD